MTNSCIQFWSAAFAAMSLGAGDVGLPLRFGVIDRTGKQSAQWVAFSRDCRKLATANCDGSIRVFSLATRKQTSRITQPDGHPLFFFVFGPVIFSPDAKSLVALGPANVICIWDLPAGKEQKRLSWRGELIDEFGLAADGRTLAVQTFPERGDEYRIHFWDRVTGKEVRSIKFRVTRDRARGIGQGYGPVFSPDGKLLASAMPASMIRLWDVATGKELRQLKVDDRRSVCSIAFSPDGKYLLSANNISPWGSSRNASVQLWEVASGKQVLVDEVEEWVIKSVGFSPEGRTFAGACGDGTIQLWEVISGKKLVRFQEKGNKVSCIAYAPDGNGIASAMSDGTALLWKMAPAPLRTAAEAWEKLAHSDAKQAYRAVHTLSADPESVSLLKARLKAVTQEQPARIRELVQRFDNEDFGAREAAMVELCRLGPQVEAELRKAANTGGPEIRKRSKWVLERLHRWTIDDPETLRGLRSIWILERIGTSAARDLLAELAKGAPDARLTQEAQNAVKRLKR